MKDVKHNTWRSKEYLEYIRFLDCASCGAAPPNDAHHVSLGNTGMGMKAPDSQAISLCRVCHGLEHQGHGMPEEVKFEAIIQCLARWIEMGGIR